MATKDSLSFVVCCKGRLAHLKQTLPALVAQKDAQVVVVDYDCPEGTADWVAQHYPDVTVAKTEYRPTYNASIARNIGLKEARNDWVCFIDADIVIADDFYEELRPKLAAGSYFRFDEKGPSAFGDAKFNLVGTVIVEREAIEHIGGYDVAFKSWGGEDRDLYDRLRFNGLTCCFLPNDLVKDIIGHSNEMRLRFHKESRLDEVETITTLYRAAKYHVIGAEMLSSNSYLDDQRCQRLYEAAENTVKRALAADDGKATLLLNHPNNPITNFRFATVSQKLSIEIDASPLKRRMQ